MTTFGWIVLAVFVVVAALQGYLLTGANDALRVEQSKTRLLEARQASARRDAIELDRTRKFLRSVGISQTVVLNNAAQNAYMAMVGEAVRAASLQAGVPPALAGVVNNTATTGISLNGGHTANGYPSRRPH